jgi:hypothetical protein
MNDWNKVNNMMDERLAAAKARKNGNNAPS